MSKSSTSKAASTQARLHPNQTCVAISLVLITLQSVVRVASVYFKAINFAIASLRTNAAHSHHFASTQCVDHDF